MDFVPVTESDAAHPATGDALDQVAVEIMNPQDPTGILPERATRPTISTLHLVKPALVTGPAVGSPVVRPQVVSVLKGQVLVPGVRGQTRVLPVVKLPAGSISAVSSMFMMKPRPASPEPTQAEVEAFRAQQMAASVKLPPPEDSVVDEDHQTTSLQELISHSSLGHQPDHLTQPSPAPETQPQASPLVELQPPPPPVETKHRVSPARVDDSVVDPIGPIITLSCGSSYAAAMDNALQGVDLHTGERAEVDAAAEDVDTNTSVAATAFSAVAEAEEDDEDDVPLSSRKRKSASRGRGRKRPRSSSASAAPPAPPPPPPPFPCDDCEERFDDRLALVAHERRHGDALHTCGVCRQTFTQSLALRRHKLHHGQAPKPRTGRRRAKAPSRYLDAAWGELGIRRTRGGAQVAETVTCGVCDEELSPEEVADHLSPPNNMGYYRCAQCGGAFGQRCQLNRHGCRRQGDRRGVRKAKKQKPSRVSAAAAATAAAEAAEAEESGAESPEGAQDSGSDWDGGDGADSMATSAVAEDAPADADAVDAADAAAVEGAGAGRLTCDVCQINFVSRRNLQRHRAQHENGTRYSCEVCEQSYARIDDLTRHSRSAHQQKRQFRCPRCMRRFTQKRIVQYHLRTHMAASKKSGSTAKNSGKAADGTKTEPNADGEMKDPPGPGLVRYTCEVCGAGFDTRRRYTRHQQLRHDAETPRYECEVCDASYARIDELTRHSIQIHRQKKTVPCPRCTRLFTQQRIVDYHVVGHDTKRVYMKAPRPFQCKQCQRGFSTEALLSEHNCRNGKNSTQRCVCDICGRGISCPQALRRHRLQHNEERPAKCGTCGAGFIDELALSKHMLTHSEEKPYLCDHCGKGFRFKDYLVRHTRFHTGERPYTCSACDKSFATSDTLNRHFLIHTGEKPFACKVCARQFRQAQQLKTHMKVHRRKEVPPYFTQHKEKQEPETLCMQLAEMTGADVRLVEDFGDDIRLAENGSGDIRLAENVGGDIRLAENGGGDIRLAENGSGDMRMADIAGGDARLVGNVAGDV